MAFLRGLACSKTDEPAGLDWIDRLANSSPIRGLHRTGMLRNQPALSIGQSSDPNLALAEPPLAPISPIGPFP
jgi:hypothetical protein